MDYDPSFERKFCKEFEKKIEKHRSIGPFLYQNSRQSWKIEEKIESFEFEGPKLS